MDWRGGSVSRSRSRAPGMRLDRDPLDQNESHSQSLLANLEEETTPGADADQGGHMPIPKESVSHQKGAEDGAGVSSSIATAAAVPIPASTGSSNQSLLSLRLQGLQRPSEPDATKASTSAPLDHAPLAAGIPLFQPPPNPFQNAQYTAMFMPSSLPSFPHIADPFSESSHKVGESSTAGATSQEHIKVNRGRPRKTSFDHTVAAQYDKAAKQRSAQSALSPVLSNSSLVSSSCFSLHTC